MPKQVGWLWKITGWYVKPKNARELMNILGAIGVHSVGQNFAWRGMSSADYVLTSSLQRSVKGREEAVREAELKILREAREWGLGTHGAGHVDDLQLLSDLQHYGIATRLIDFTSNPMTALWFACQTPKDVNAGKSGLLLALNITGWDKISTLPSPGGVTYGDLADPTGARLSKALASTSPFIVGSANPNDRLRAQEGFFIAGQVPDLRIARGENWEMSEATPFQGIHLPYTTGKPDQLYEGLLHERGVGAPGNIPFVGVIVASALKSKLIKYLEGTYNRSARVLFPDYAGLLEFGARIPRREGVN